MIFMSVDDSFDSLCIQKVRKTKTKKNVILITLHLIESTQIFSGGKGTKMKMATKRS